MSINMRNEYDTLIQTFVVDNYETLSKAKKYRPNADRETCFTYIAELNQPTDMYYIRANPKFRALVNTFVDKFLYREGMTFQIGFHMKGLHGKLLTDLMDQKEDGYHYFSRDNLTERFSLQLLMDVFTLFLHIRDKQTGSVRYHLFMLDDNRIEIKMSATCPTCNAYFSLVVDYTKNAVVIDDIVPVADCIQKMPTRVNVTLKSPSGKLVFLNHPSEFFKLQREDRYELSINSTLGCIAETKFYAKHNIGYFFVGNTRAYIMQKEGVILSALYDEYNDKEVAKYKDYTLRGNVCTGVWWYTVLDYDLYLKLCSEYNVDPASIEHCVVETNALKYKVSHSLAAHTKGHRRGVYSKITY